MKPKKLFLFATLSACITVSAHASPSLTSSMAFAPLPPGQASVKVRKQLRNGTIPPGIEMQTTEVTQEQWVEIMGTNPSDYEAEGNCAETYREVNRQLRMCPNHPVEMVSWDDTQEFIARLNARHDGFIYRLPTDFEWVYAAQAGSASAGGGWKNPDLGGQPHDVKLLPANAWGIYDMYGNVWQWLQDADDREGWSGRRLTRGCSFDVLSWCTQADRGSEDPASSDRATGFRLVRTR